MQYEPFALAALAEAKIGLDDLDGWLREKARRGAEGGPLAMACGPHEAHCRMVLGGALARSRPGRGARGARPRP